MSVTQTDSLRSIINSHFSLYLCDDSQYTGTDVNTRTQATQRAIKAYRLRNVTRLNF